MEHAAIILIAEPELHPDVQVRIPIMTGSKLYTNWFMLDQWPDVILTGNAETGVLTYVIKEWSRTKAIYHHMDSCYVALP